MKSKKIFLVLAAAALLFCTACSETAPIDDTLEGGNGGVAAAPSEGSAPSQEDEPFGKTLLFRKYTYKDRETFSIDYEFTVKKLQIFDHYRESGLPEEDFIGNFVTDQPFVLIDLTIKKTSGPKREEVPYEDTIEVLKLANREMREADKNGSQTISPLVPCYFSSYSQENYYHYWLEPGEEKTYQVGWCLDDPEDAGMGDIVYGTNTQGLALYLGLGDGLSGDCIELTP